MEIAFIALSLRSLCNGWPWNGDLTEQIVIRGCIPILDLLLFLNTTEIRHGRGEVSDRDYFNASASQVKDTASVQVVLNS